MHTQVKSNNFLICGDFTSIVYGGALSSYLLAISLLKKNLYHRNIGPHVLVDVDDYRNKSMLMIPSYSLNSSPDFWFRNIGMFEKKYFERFGEIQDIPPLKHLSSYLTPIFTSITINDQQLWSSDDVHLNIVEFFRKAPSCWHGFSYEQIRETLISISSMSKKSFVHSPNIKESIETLISKIVNNLIGEKASIYLDNRLSKLFDNHLLRQLSKMLYQIANNYLHHKKDWWNLEIFFQLLTSSQSLMCSRSAFRSYPSPSFSSKSCKYPLRSQPHSHPHFQIEDMVILLLEFFCGQYRLNLKKLKEDLLDFFIRQGGVVVAAQIENIQKQAKGAAGNILINLQARTKSWHHFPIDNQQGFEVRAMSISANKLFLLQESLNYGILYANNACEFSPLNPGERHLLINDRMIAAGSAHCELFCSQQGDLSCNVFYHPEATIDKVKGENIRIDVIETILRKYLRNLLLLRGKDIDQVDTIFTNFILNRREVLLAKSTDLPISDEMNSYHIYQQHHCGHYSCYTNLLNHFCLP